jgi:Mg-chelatase subunit ChlD
MKTFPILSAAILWAASSLSAVVPAKVETPPTQNQSQHQGAPKVDVCFVLDTTGSMAGLIEAAKQKIWHIANQLAGHKPAPQIRFALIGYRDRGDAYVTSLNQLTDDLDSIYGALLQFRADGGGDGPESVNQALHEAVTKLAWDRDQNTRRIVFLVGDAPPHMDYANDVPYMETCELACQRGIIINTLQCGNMKETPVHWSAIAKLGGGHYVRVPQDGGACDVQTPQDAEIQDLTRKLNETVIPYGETWQQKAAVEKLSNSSAGKPEQQAARAACISKNGEGKVITGNEDLVDAVNRGDVPLAKVNRDHLPADLRKLDDEGLKAVVEKRQADRAALQKKLAELGKQRDEFIAKAESNKGEGEKSAFDAKVGSMLEEQLAR